VDVSSPEAWDESFGTDKDRVEGYALRGADTVLRWFLPIPLSDPPRSLSWGMAARISNLSLSPQVTWKDIADAWSGAGHSELLTQPMGTVDHRSMDALLSTLAGVVGLEEEVEYAVWEGYADMAVLLAHTSSAPADPSRFLTQGGVRTFTAPLGTLSMFTAEEGRHFPSAVWLRDHHLAIAQPIYNDSCYISGPRDVCETLCADDDIDLIEIDPSLLLPSGVVMD